METVLGQSPHRPLRRRRPVSAQEIPDSADFCPRFSGVDRAVGIGAWTAFRR